MPRACIAVSACPDAAMVELSQLYTLSYQTSKFYTSTNHRLVTVVVGQEFFVWVFCYFFNIENIFLFQILDIFF